MISEKRNILQERLKPILIKNCINKRILKQVKSDLSQVGILAGTVQDIFNQRIAVETLNIATLYYLSKSLHKNLPEESINPIYFFKEKELRKINSKRKIYEMQKDLILPIQASTVIKLGDNNYVTFISVKDLVNMYKVINLMVKGELDNL